MPIGAGEDPQSGEGKGVMTGAKRDLRSHRQAPFGNGEEPGTDPPWFVQLLRLLGNDCFFGVLVFKPRDERARAGQCGRRATTLGSAAVERNVPAGTPSRDAT